MVLDTLQLFLVSDSLLTYGMVSNLCSRYWVLAVLCSWCAHIPSEQYHVTLKTCSCFSDLSHWWWRWWDYREHGIRGKGESSLYGKFGLMTRHLQNI